MGKCISICRNPQNVGSPETGPTLELSAPSAVVTQLTALQNNATPRPNHGLAVVRTSCRLRSAHAVGLPWLSAYAASLDQAYEWCGDIDAFERSRYFGVSKDIYQFDHFMSAWTQHFPGFLELKAFDVLGSKELADGRVEVSVTVTGRHAREPREYVFIMKRATAGKYTGCWVTHRLLAADSKFRGVV